MIPLRRMIPRVSVLLLGTGFTHVSLSLTQNDMYTHCENKNESWPSSDTLKELSKRCERHIKDIKNGKSLSQVQDDIVNSRTRVLFDRLMHEWFHSTLTRQVGVGFVSGYTTGYFARRAVHIGTLLAGVYIFLQYSVSNSGHTVQMPKEVTATLEELKKVDIAKTLTETYRKHVPKRIQSSLPSVGAFAVGFALGFRR